MLSSAKAPQAPPSERTTRKIHAVLEMHQVSFGAAEDLPRFLQKLREDRHLAMDFWAAVAAIGKESEELSNDELLDIFVRGITQKNTREAQDFNDEVCKAVEEFRRLLAGEDVDPPIEESENEKISWSESPQEEPNALAEKNDIEQAPGGSWTSFAEEDKTDEVRGTQEEKSSPTLEISNEEQERLRDQLNEALLRLELNNLELKLQLDGINSRMSRLEPHLRELLTKGSSTPLSDDVAAEQTTLRLASDSADQQKELDETFDSAYRSTRRVEDSSRLVLRADAIDDDDPSIVVPLEHYSKPLITGNIAIFISTLILLTAVLFVYVWHRYDTIPLKQFALSSTQVLHEKYQDFSTELHSAFRSSKPNEESISTTPATDAAAAAKSPAPSTTHDAPPGTVPPNKSQTRTISSQTERSSRGHRLHQDVGQSSDEIYVSARDHLSGMPVNVPASLMQENLISSRVPAYPDAAKAQGIQGTVMMRAIISKNGTVGHLQVIDGDPLLRAAATEAVSRWRYRPYTLDGSPVEVATTVRVDFRLPNR
jgi:TonB family protein